MNRDTSPDLHYLSGFGNEFASEALPGAACRAELPAEGPVWPVCRAAVGHGVHHDP